MAAIVDDADTDADAEAAVSAYILFVYRIHLQYNITVYYLSLSRVSRFSVRYGQ